MRTYTYAQSTFSEAEAARITRFLTDYAGEGEFKTSPGLVAGTDVAVVPAASIPDQPAQPGVAVEPVVPAPGTQPPTPDIAVAPAVPPRPAAVVAGRVKPPAFVPPRNFWHPSRNVLKLARLFGFLAVACLVGLLISGFTSREQHSGFRRIHTLLALGLFLSLAVHALVNIVEYGTPSVLWYWFGLIGFLALVVTQVQGILHKRFQKGLRMWHISGACAGLGLVVLHWIWAWL